MVTVVSFVRFSIIAACCLLFILFATQRDVETYPRTLKFTEPIQDQEDTFNFSVPTITIADIIKRHQDELYKNLSKLLSNLKLENLTLATGGQPVRSVIITTWRSGSTFLGDVLNAVPGNFYHYEPLLNFGIVQIRDPPLAERAINNLKQLLKCNYYDLNNYLNYGKAHVYLFTHNYRLWNECERYPQFCWNATFLSDFCKLYPFQSMKVVRLRLKLAEELLKDQSLNVKVLLLVRDPRGTLQSRKHRDWCPGAPDCDQPKLLCNDMVSDYEAAADLQKKYSDRFRAVRYEDLSVDPYNHIPDLFKFFGLTFHENVKKFLDSHTKTNAGGVSSTFRDSKSAPFHWRLDLNFTEVQYIEENCHEAMKLWGYVKAKNETHLKEFNPVTPYVID